MDRSQTLRSVGEPSSDGARRHNLRPFAVRTVRLQRVPLAEAAWMYTNCRGHPRATNRGRRVRWYRWPTFAKGVAIAVALRPAALLGQGVRADSVPKGETRQVLDTEFTAPLRGPAAFPRGEGPVVWIDEAHHNFHTAGGRYRPFARLLEADGFQVRANRAVLDRATLEQARVLV